jgi:branched-chain amino acid transport system permease protein/urea transport system permease protein
MVVPSNSEAVAVTAELASLVGPLLDALIASATVLILSFGLFVVYGLFRVVNMAHGEMVMLGAYIASNAQSAGISFLGAAALATISIAAVASIMDVICIGRLRRQSPVATLLATWGFGLLIAQSVRLIEGAGGRFVTAPTNAVIQITGTVFPIYHIFLLMVAALMFLATFYFLSRTWLGIHIRAAAEDVELAEVYGMDSKAMFSYAFAFGGALAGFAGAILAPLQAINPFVGTQFSVSSFLVIISGGLGSVSGPLLGSVLVGGGKSLLNHWSNITVSTFAMFAIVAALLVLRRRDVDLR